MDDWDEAEFAAQLEIEAAMEMEAERWAAPEAAPAEAPPAADAPDAPTEVPNGIPTSDWDALQVLLSVAGNCWRSCGKTLFIYDDGIWTPESGPTGPLFTALCTLSARANIRPSPLALTTPGERSHILTTDHSP